MPNLGHNLLKNSRFEPYIVLTEMKICVFFKNRRKNNGQSMLDVNDTA